MESASILTPRTPGRSRFSKALPAPPKFDVGLPSSPRPAAPLPPLPPKAATAAASIASSTARSMDSPLPPVPLQASSPPPAPMSIPRRPVASSGNPQQQQQQPPAPPPPSQPSPVGSISSLLSAYSHSSGESLMKSSEGTASTKNSYIAISPGRDDLLGDLKKDLLLTPLSSFSTDVNESLKLLQSQTQTRPPQTRELPPPPPPAKEDGRPQTPVASPQEQQQQTATNSGSPGGINTSPSQPQLWRRRSLKTDRNLTVSELKLTISHGSTASTQQPQQPPSAASSLAPPNPASNRPSPSPRSPLGLPGRNIRPVPSRELVRESPVVAEILSKMEAKIEESRAAEPRPKAADAETKLGVPPPFRRLPTPEYERDDVKSSLVPTILSPVSPASSPELPAKEPEARQQPPIARKAVGLVGRDIRPVKSTPSLSPQPAATPPPPVASEAPHHHQIPAVLRPGGDAAASRDVTPQRSQFPARTTSRSAATQPSQVMLRRQPAEVVAPAAEPPPTVFASQERPVVPEVVEVLVEEEEEEVVAPSPPLSLDTSESALSREAGEPESSATSPSENAVVFPVSFANPAPPGTVFAAPPLSTKNFRCLQQHRQMYKDRNLHCPLSCQTCQRHDAEMRWKCKWCYLRICAPCMEVLHENQRDLQLLLDHLEDPKNAVVAAAPADEDPVEPAAAESASSIPIIAAPLPVALEA